MFSKEAIEAVREGVRKGEPVRGPFDVQILPLNICNQACGFCPLHTGDERLVREHSPRFLEPGMKMEWSLFERIVDGLAGLGEVERVHFTGGEPLLHPRIADMVSELKRRFSKATVGVVTNGVLLAEKFEELAAAGLDRISVSLNAADEETYIKLSPSNMPEDFRNVIRGLENTGSYKRERLKKRPALEVSITCVLTRHNYGSVEKMLDIATDVNANSLTFLPLTPFEYERTPSNRDFAVSADQFQLFLQRVKKFATKAREKGVWMGYGGNERDGGILTMPSEKLVLPCYAGYAFIVFWPDGNVRPCCNCEAVMGNISRHSLSEIWHSEAYREFRLEAISAKIQKKMRCSCKECGYLYENGFLHTHFPI